jgi:ATP-binding cassette subfamily C protein CydC
MSAPPSTPHKPPSSGRSQRDWATLLQLFVRTAGRRLLLGVLLASLTVLAGMALLGLSGWFITAAALAGLGVASSSAFNVFLPSAAIRLLALGRTAGRYAERLVTHDATFAVLAALREQLFRSWAEPASARQLLRRPARLLFRLTLDIDALESIYLRLWLPALAALAAALLAGAVLGSLDWRLGAASCGGLLLYGWGVALWTARRARQPALRRGLMLERLRAQTIDLVAGQSELALAGQLARHCAQLAQTDARLAALDERLHRLETRCGWLYGMATPIAVAALLLALGALADSGGISTPAAALALLLALTALEPFAALRRGALEAGRSALASRRLAARLRTTSTTSSTHNASTAQPLRPDDAQVALQLDAVDAGHERQRAPVLQQIRLQLHRGERVALVGHSGAGKSTLLALIAGELSPRRGRLQAQACSWLTQRTELFQDSVRDNLLLAQPQASDSQLWHALRASGLAADIMQLPHGLDTLLGEGGLGLSGGQSRRLALARLLLQPADCWLLDEPTEGLDSATASDVLSRLAGLAGRNTVLIATHLRREAQLADRLLLIEQGRIVAQPHRGSPDFDAALATLRPH